MRIRTLACTAMLVLALVAFALPARAEEGEGPGSIEEQIKKKMEEILRLMQENEEILLRASTGASGKPRRVDVDVPEPPSKGGTASKGGSGGDGSSGGASGKGGGASGGGEKGAEVARKMRELIEGQRNSGGKIPGEMGKLLRMIPKRSGKGQGQGQPQDGEGEGSKEEQEAREARKQLGQKHEEKQGDKDPTKGDKSPQNPADRVPKGGKPEDVKPDGSKRDDDVPPWAAALPPEIRDAMAGGRAEDVPAKYRHLVKRYHLWLQKNRKGP